MEIHALIELFMLRQLERSVIDGTLDERDKMLSALEVLRSPAIKAHFYVAPKPDAFSFQDRVEPWLLACFGALIAGDKIERNHRFLEEALELVQALGCTKSEVIQLVDYVYGRFVGEPKQEVGGVMVTLAALCRANDIDMHLCGEIELNRIWGKVDQIRAKQAAKPKNSPLPSVHAATPGDGCHFYLIDWQGITTFDIGETVVEAHDAKEARQAWVKAFSSTRRALVVRQLAVGKEADYLSKGAEMLWLHGGGVFQRVDSGESPT